MGVRWFAGLLLEVIVLAALFVALPMFVFVMGVAADLVP